MQEVEIYDNYILYEDGNIKVKKTGKFLKDPTQKKYPTVFLIDKEGILNRRRLHQLVYEKFCGTVKNDKMVIFKDGNSKNYHYTNLICVSKKENSKTFQNQEIVMDPNLKWVKVFGHEHYKISEKGDVYSCKINIINSASERPNGYLSLSLRDNNGKRKIEYIHKLVYTSFHNIDLSLEDKKVIDHINRDRLDNSISNLRLVSYSENNKNSEKKKCRPLTVLQYSLNNKFIKKWETALQAAKELNFSNHEKINKCCFGKIKDAHGFIWHFENKIHDISDYVNIVTDDGIKYLNYKINREGKIINKNNLLMKPKEQEYHRVGLTENRVSKEFAVHRLVALTFLKNEKNYPIVNHKDENKKNNNVENLEWTNHTKNAIHSSSKDINQIDIKTGKIIATFNSINNANIALNKKGGSGIGQTLGGKQKTAYGFKWEYSISDKNLRMDEKNLVKIKKEGG